MANAYFRPLDAFGTQSFQQAGQPAGWYQFLVDVPVVPTIPIVLRDIAQGLLIQAISEIRYCLSPAAAAAGTTAYLVLPAGTTLFLSGAQSMRQFCILLPAAGAEFVVQIYTGNIGPIPLINQPAAAAPGPPPPPPPGGAVVPTSNTLHVMAAPWGNDATGTRERLDLPFLTCAAAEAAASSGDTIMVWNGTFTGGGLGTTSLFYRLHGATLTCAAGPLFDISSNFVDISGSGSLQGAIDGPVVNLLNGRFTNNGIDLTGAQDGIVGDTCEIFGTFSIRSQRQGITTIGDCTVEIRGNVTTQTGIGLYFTDQIAATIYGDVTTNSVTGNDAISALQRGNVFIYGNVTSQDGISIYTDRCNMNVIGNVTSFAGRAVLISDTAKVSINGNISAGTEGVDTGTSGIFELFGNIDAEDIGLKSTGGSVNMTGNVTSKRDDAVSIDSATANITGTLIGANDGVSLGAGLRAVDSNTTFFGNAYGLGTQNAIILNNGSIIHNGIASHLNTAAAVFMQGVVQAELHGTYIGGSSSGAIRLLNCTAGTAVNVYGSATGTFSGLFMQGSSGAVVHMYSEVVGNTNGAVVIQNGGRVYLHSFVRCTTAIAAVRISGAATDLHLMAGCRIERTGAGNSITSFSPGGQVLTIRSFVASANTAIEGTLIVNGVLNIIV